MNPKDKELSEELFSLVARHKVVPFFGAGCSKGHLGATWNTIRDEMVKRTGTSKTNHLDAASEYESKFGRGGLAKFLKKHFEVKIFEDIHGSAHLALLGLNMGSYYTTNQDHLFELCSEKYGRQLRVIIGVRDFAVANAGEQFLYKYHGTLERPDSIVFTRKDFIKRTGNSDHPLDIRLRSDAIAKSLLFLGYSFRDPNVQYLFRHLKKVFKEKLPHSFLVEFESDSNFEEEMKDYGIECIAPTRLYPGKSPLDAFNLFNTEMVKTVFRERKGEFDTLFKSPEVRNAIPVAMPIEIEALEEIIHDGSPEEALNKYRVTIDGNLIPEDYEERVCKLFIEVCKRADDPNIFNSYVGALANLLIKDVSLAMDALAACMTIANIFPERKGISDRRLHPHHSVLKDGVDLFGVAEAIEMLKKWNRNITPGFFSCIEYWETGFVHLSKFSKEIQDYIVYWFNSAYAGNEKNFENPIKRMERLGKSYYSVCINNGVNKRTQDMMNQFKRIKGRPFND